MVALNMAAQATILNDIVSNAARAADSAAEAARALREAADRPKVVKCPEFFCDVTGDEDQNNWRDFAFSFKARLTFADAEFDRELGIIEEASQTPIALPAEPDTLQRAYKVCAILSGLLRQDL